MIKKIKELPKQWLILLIIILLLLISGIIYFSYALFSTTVEKGGTLNIVTGEFSYIMKSSDLTDNQITVEAGKTKIFSLEIENTNSRDTSYGVYYIMKSPSSMPSGAKIGYTDYSNTQTKGELITKGEKKTFEFGVENKSNQTITVQFGVQGGLVGKELTITNGTLITENLKSEANAPELDTNMIPVKYDESKQSWVKADINNSWYDYQNQIWANAVTVKENKTVVQDKSANKYNLELKNGAKIENNALVLDGIDDYGKLPTLPATIKWTDGFSIEFEAEWNTLGSWSRIFDFGNNHKGNNIFLSNYITSNSIILDLLDAEESPIITTNAIIKDEKAMFKVTVEKAATNYKVKTYKNNVLLSEQSTTNFNCLKNVERLTNYIGKSNWWDYVHGDKYFSGKIYNLKITDASSNPIIWYDFSDATTISTDGNQSRNYYQNATPGTAIKTDDILSHFVWIPKYEYQYTNLETKYAGGTREQPGEIKINFVAKAKTQPSDAATYKIHPAFTFGTKELSGFWVGKFETTGIIAKPCTDFLCIIDHITIRPNQSSLRNQTISSFFNISRSLQKVGNPYGFTNSVDTHMMKNSEWGAVAYLSQSKYGKYGNPDYSGANKEIYQNKSTSFITGNSNGTPSTDVTNGQVTYNINGSGTGASTTGNIYGIYDMSGGVWEFVMGNYDNGTGKLYPPTSDFIEPYPDIKYYNLYTSSSAASACNGTNCYGEALSEISQWYGDESKFLSTPFPWLTRGGGNYNNATSGIFSYSDNSYSDGVAGIRISIVSNE